MKNHPNAKYIGITATPKRTDGRNMLYEKLKNLLSEWDLYTSKEAEIPERIMKLEKWSIAKSVEITIAEMRSNNELEKISEEDKEKIEMIFNYLSIMASTK